MKFYSPMIRLLERLSGVEDNDKNGKVQVRFLFWAVVPSLFLLKLIMYSLNFAEGVKEYPCLAEPLEENFSWIIEIFKFLSEEPGFSELASSVLSFIADHTGMEFIKNLNIIKFIENFDPFWSSPIIVLICFIINRHALYQYNRDKGRGLHYYALLAHMFMFYTCILKFQWFGLLLYIVAIFITSSVWYLLYIKRPLGVSYGDIFAYNLVYSFLISILTPLYALFVAVIAVPYMIVELWGPSPEPH